VIHYFQVKLAQYARYLLSRLYLTLDDPQPVQCPHCEVSAAGMLPSSLHGWIHGALAMRALHRLTRMVCMVL